MSFVFQRAKYEEPNARQKEAFNFQKECRFEDERNRLTQTHIASAGGLPSTDLSTTHATQAASGVA